MEYWTLEDNISGRGGVAIPVVWVSSTGENYLAVVSEWFPRYVIKELEMAYDCYDAKVDDHFDATVLGKTTIALRL